MVDVIQRLDDTLGWEPHTVTFTNNSTEQFDCVWDMGDGTIINDCGPITYTYDVAGTYDVALTVTSDQGCTASFTNYGYIEVVPFLKRPIGCKVVANMIDQREAACRDFRSAC